MSVRHRPIITALQASRSRKNHLPASASCVTSNSCTADDYIALICWGLVVIISALIILADCLAPESSPRKELTPVPVFIKSQRR